MEQGENQMNKTYDMYKRVEHFFSEMSGRYEIIYSENDFPLIDTNGRGYMYYPESIKTVIETKTVMRMNISVRNCNIYTSKRITYKIGTQQRYIL